MNLHFYICLGVKFILLWQRFKKMNMPFPLIEFNCSISGFFSPKYLIFFLYFLIFTKDKLSCHQGMICKHLLDSEQSHADPKHKCLCYLFLSADTLFIVWHVYVFLLQKYMYTVLEWNPTTNLPLPCIVLPIYPDPVAAFYHLDKKIGA